MNDLAKIFTKTAFSILLVLTVTACGGGDDKGVPPTDKKPDPTTPPNPTTPPLVGTVLSGVVMIGPVINADVTVSEITLDKSNSPIKLKLITLNTTSQQTNDKGEYALSIKPVADNTPILVCATGGTYTEPASAALITPVEKTFQSQAQLCPTDLLCEEEKLCAVAIVKRDEKLTVNLTYFSHLAYGLAESRLLKGATLLDVSRNNSNGSTSLVLGGISNANKIVSDWLQLTTTSNPVNKGVISVTPQDITITPVTNNNATLTNEIKYGFANAAISDLVEWMRLTSSTTQKVPAFDKVSTVALAQQVFKDIIDGDMDGKQNATSLFLSDTAIIGHMLRYHFAFKLFVVASNRRINQTGLNNSDIDSFVKSLNKYGIFFTSTPQVTIVNTKPVLSHIYPNDNGIINGDVNIKIDATDISDISSIAMTIDTVPPGGNLLLPTDVLAANPEKPEWSITTVSEVTPATPGIPDGVYDIKFVATNTQGVSTTRLMPNIRISNKDIHLHIVNPPIVSTTVGPKNPINSLAGFTSIVNDVFFMENSNNSSVKFSIISTDLQSTLAPITVPLKVPAFNPISPISRRYFASDLSNANPVIVPDGKYKLVVDGTSGKNVTPLLAASNNVEFEYDTQRPIANFSAATPDFTVFTGVATINLDVKDQPKDGYESGIKTTSLSHDAIGGGEVPATVMGNQSIINFTEQGWHKLTLNAMDYAGNAAKTRYLNVGHDVKKPSISIFNNLNISGQWWSTLDIISTVDDIGTGILNIYTGINVNTPNGGTRIYDGSSTAPDTKKSYSYTDNNIQSQVTTDGVYRYTVRAADFAISDSLHTVTKNLLDIGIDTTPPKIKFIQENVLLTAFPSTSGINQSQFTDVKNISSQNVVVDKVNKTASINWSIDALVTELGYQLPTGKLAGSDSGIGLVKVDGSQLSLNNLDIMPITISPKVTITGLPQYQITSSATVQVVWEVVATCPAPTAGTTNLMIIDATTNQCSETLSDGTPVPAMPIDKVVYEWTKGNVSYPVATDASNMTVLASLFASPLKKIPLVISATDKAQHSDTTKPSGNKAEQFACLNFRIKNTTTDSIFTPRGIGSEVAIAQDAGAVENSNSPDPIIISGLQAPVTFPCVETIPLLIPIIDPANTPPLVNVNKATCTITGLQSSKLNTTLTSLLVNAQNFAIEVQVEMPLDPIVTSANPAKCP